MDKTASVTPAQTAAPPSAIASGLSDKLAIDVSAASLGLFRFFFGVVMLLEAISIVRPMASAAGSIPLETYYTSPEIRFHLPYAAFTWLPLFAPGVVRLIVGLLGVASAALAFGVASRISAAVVFLTWGYLYAVESTRTYWMSYYYLELLVAFLLIWVPAGHRFSMRNLFVDSNSKKNAALAPVTVPFWSILLFRLQLVITYFYAGLAKINADWLLDAQPIRKFLADASVGAPAALQSIFNHVPFAFFLSWAGAIFDLSVGFLLLARRTRVLGMLLLIVFHSTNHLFLFDDIVWFPLLGVLSATIFLNPDWPDRFLKWLRKPHLTKPDLKWLVPGAILVPILGAALGWKSAAAERFRATSPISKLCLSLFIAWIAFQVLLPARHLLIPGDVRITFEGLSFSWRLKAEVYRVEPAQIIIADEQIISKTGGEHVIHWDKWSSDKTLFRFVDRASIVWTNLPEIVVVHEPLLGDRIFYNPVSAGRSLNEAEARARITQIWQERFGRAPSGMARTFPVAEILQGYARSLQNRGASADRSPRELLRNMFTDPKLSALTRRLHPFDSEGANSADLPFLIIEDPQLLRANPAGKTEIVANLWKTGPEQQAPAEKIRHEGGTPVSRFMLKDSTSSVELLPYAAIVTFSNAPNSPVVAWNMFKDATLSKAMHISTNPFLLQRYALRVAKLWHEASGHTPKVHAHTAISFNGRPLQQSVDPEIDLAAVQLNHFTHNPWINDLKQGRIPPAQARR
ncbi:MAG TPA: HTTM domain-containing protein [Verrucomicrobiae bacterium]